MRSISTGIALAALLCGALPGVAAAASISVTADRTEIGLDEQLRLTVTVENARGSEPRLPQLPDFEVRPLGQQSQVSLVNGRATATVSYLFELRPRRVGAFEIGSASVEVGGETLVSRPFEVKVVAGSAAPRDDGDLFTTATVNTTQPFVGQQVVYVWRFYRRIQVAEPQLERQEFDGFLSEELGEVRQYETVLSGRRFLVSELRRALFPQEAGSLTIPSAVLTCRVAGGQRRNRSLIEDFFGRTMSETRVVRTQPIELEVRPLPQAPDDFSGLVGEFEISSRVSQRELAVGESTTLAIEIAGAGNAQLIAPPALPEMPMFKTYDDKPEATIDRSGSRLAGSKVYRKALVPLVPGIVTVPEVGLTYFDPEAGAYRTAKAEPIVLEVAPGNGDEELRLTEALAPGAGKVAVRILADDLLPIEPDLDGLRPPRSAFWQALMALGWGAPPAIYFGLALAARRRRLRSRHADRFRRRGALRGLKRRLGRLADAPAEERAALGSLALRRYVGDKVTAEGSALTAGEAADALAAEGVDGELVESVRRLLERLDAARYGAGRAAEEDLEGEIRALAERLEGELGR